jgi:predicted dehydrogenase
MKIGLISKGASYPFGHYSSIQSRYPSIEVIGSADWLEGDSHTEIAAQGIQSMSLPELLSSQAEIIVIIAPAANHAAATKRVLEAGKHVYCERPIALSLLDVQEIQQLSVEKGLRVACGQDNFLAAT